jgi:hypothetical protein
MTFDHAFGKQVEPVRAVTGGIHENITAMLTQCTKNNSANEIMQISVVAKEYLMRL